MIDEQILVKQNNMTFDSKDPRCQLFISSTNATNGTEELKIAFITVVDDSSQLLKRYFGAWSWDDRESSIARIMELGGKWPEPFRNLVLPKPGQLD